MKTTIINNKHYQECDIVMLPVKKHHATFELEDNFLSKESSNYTHKNPQELYILSNEKIKEGDWYLLIPENHIKQAQKDLPVNLREWKKVIATSDSSLKIIDHNNTWDNSNDKKLSQIPQQFIEHYINEYNKGNVISKVFVEVVDNGEEDWVGDDYNGEPFWNEKWEIKLNQNNEISILTEEINLTTQIVREAMRIVSKDIILPKVIKDKLVTRQEKLEDFALKHGYVWENTETSARRVLEKFFEYQKQSYSREEVIKLCKNSYHIGAVDYQQSPKNINDFLLKCELSEAWIEQNLK